MSRVFQSNPRRLWWVARALYQSSIGCGSEDFKEAFNLALADSPKYTSELDVIRAECLLYPYVGLNSEEEEILDRIMRHPKSLGILSFQKTHREIDTCIEKLNMEADLDAFRECLYCLRINQDIIYHIQSSEYYSSLPQNIVEHLDCMYLEYEQTYRELIRNNYVLPVRYIIGGIPNNVPNPVDVLNKFGDSMITSMNIMIESCHLHCRIRG